MARVIAVIGGGWAGCAASIELARSGFQVTLFEAAPALGGRARAVLRDDLVLDNGQHLLLGAYTATRELASQLDGSGARGPWTVLPLAIRPFSRAQRNAVVVDTAGARAPFGLLAGIVTARGLSLRERMATIHWFVSQRRKRFRCDENLTVASLLAPVPDAVRDGLLVPLCIAALNTLPERASAQVFLNVLREAFSGGPEGSAILLPREGLGRIIPERSFDWLRANGHAVHLATRVLIADAERGVRLVHAGGEMRAQAAIVAVGPHQLAGAFDAGVIQRDARVSAAVDAARRFEWEAITTVYLGYGARVSVPPALIRLDDAPGQWVFDRADILDRSPTTARAPHLQSLLAVVISAHRRSTDEPSASIARAVDAQLRRLDPKLPPLAWSQVIAEKRATYACVPGLARPPCGRLTDALYLAGDYTYDAFPATLEGAVRSGFAAARALIGDFTSRGSAAGAAVRDSTPVP